MADVEVGGPVFQTEIGGVEGIVDGDVAGFVGIPVCGVGVEVVGAEAEAMAAIADDFEHGGFVGGVGAAFDGVELLVIRARADGVEGDGDLRGLDGACGGAGDRRGLLAAIDDVVGDGIESGVRVLGEIGVDGDGQMAAEAGHAGDGDEPVAGQLLFKAEDGLIDLLRTEVGGERDRAGSDGLLWLDGKDVGKGRRAGVGRLEEVIEVAVCGAGLGEGGEDDGVVNAAEVEPSAEAQDGFAGGGKGEAEARTPVEGGRRKVLGGWDGWIFVGGDGRGELFGLYAQAGGQRELGPGLPLIGDEGGQIVAAQAPVRRADSLREVGVAREDAEAEDLARDRVNAPG